MSKKIILLNGPPRCGKDTIANIMRRYGDFEHVKFAKILKERTHNLYDLRNISFDHYEDVKDTPSPDFLGLTPRDAYINISQIYMKPVHGNSIWADLLANEIKNSNKNKFVISDLGFQKDEWHTFLNEFGLDQLWLIKIYRDGCNFDNDSRKYIEIEDSDIDKKVAVYENNKTELDLIPDTLGLMGGI